MQTPPNPSLFTAIGTKSMPCFIAPRKNQDAIANELRDHR
jgi:hypothetical protein